MERRKFIFTSGAFAVISLMSNSVAAAFGSNKIRKKFSRVRPGDPLWPSGEQWGGLGKSLTGKLIKLESPFSKCQKDPNSEACKLLFDQLKNPYYIGDHPELTQTCGWLDGWLSEPSAYAVAAETSADVAAAINFAREKNLRLVVKGGGHSYQGTSSAADSLLIWTKKMNGVTLKNNFIPSGTPEGTAVAQVVTVGSGAVWMHVYNEVTTKSGRYVQGGGCGTVGVAGLIQSGGFGSFSKNYGLAAASLLEAEVVTANGAVITANDYKHPDLFWALKGGGGGSFGVVTKLTLRTHELPEFFGAAFGKVKAKTDEAFKKLIARVIAFYQDKLFNPHWGEQIRFHGNNLLEISMMFQGLTQDEANETWQPFMAWISTNSQDYAWSSPLKIAALPARQLWNPEFLEKYAGEMIGKDDRAGAPSDNIFWAGDKEQSGQYLYGYHSAWLSKSLLLKENQEGLAHAIFESSRYWSLSLHFNKGLAGAPTKKIGEAKNTAINPAVLDAFALVIIAGGEAPAYTGIPGHEVDQKGAQADAAQIKQAMAALKPIIPNPASYVSESDFFETGWQKSFWGNNYGRLKKTKRQYDSEGLFFVHHGVGSEDWSSDGFTRILD
jgi:hypothetical protein